MKLRKLLAMCFVGVLAFSLFGFNNASADTLSDVISSDVMSSDVISSDVMLSDVMSPDDISSASLLPPANNGAIVLKVFTSKTGDWSQSYWSQDEYTYYLKSAKAREYAGQIETGSGAQVTQFVTSTLVGVRFVPAGALVGGLALLDNLRKSSMAKEIREKSESGHVKFTLIKHRFGWGYSPVTNWDGINIDLSESSNYKVTGYGYVK